MKANISEPESQPKLFQVILMALLVIVVVISLLNRKQIQQVEEQISSRPPGKYVMPDFASIQVTIPSTVQQTQTVYVPVYSHIYYRQGTPLSLETTLSIRNRDLNKYIYLSKIEYYDSQGDLVKSHLESPIRLNALQTINILVEARNHEGGSGANFLVEWQAEADAQAPIIEAVMVGVAGTQGVAFLGEGSILTEKITSIAAE